MQRRAHCHLHRFQIETARLAAIVEDDPQQLVYFAGDFLTDRFGLFFLWHHRICLGWTYLADLDIDLNECLVQTLQFPEFSDLSFRFPDCRRIGQRLGDSLASDFVGEAEVGTIPRIFGLMAVAVERSEEHTS